MILRSLLILRKILKIRQRPFNPTMIDAFAKASLFSKNIIGAKLTDIGYGD